jgi:hypothetical protein
MADNPLSGSDPGEDKSRGKKESVEGKEKNGDKRPNVKQKPNSAAMNARRRRQRQKFSAALNKEGTDVIKRSSPKDEVFGKKSVSPASPKPARDEERPVREELHPRPVVTDRGQSRRAENPVAPEPASPPEPVREEPIMSKKPPVVPVASEDESAKREEVKSPAENENGERGGVTYFAHPFAPEEKPAEDLPQEQAVEPVREPVSEPVDNEIIIGEEEPAPPIPVGRLSETEPLPKKEIEENVKVEEPMKEKTESAPLEAQKRPEEDDKDKKEQLAEKESVGRVLKSWAQRVWPKIRDTAGGGLSSFGSGLSSAFSRVSVGKVFSCLALAALLAGGVYGYGQKWHERAYSYVIALVTPKPVEKVEVRIDKAMQRQFGIISTSIFGANGGSEDDLVPPHILMAVYFGELREPRVKGETGISAATFYGELKDGADVVNQFVVYLGNLEDVQNLYKTDVYEMLDRSTERDKVLLDYLEKLKEAREKSKILHDQIVINADDFRKSYDSLSPDKTKYEQDFFTAMEMLEPEKSDLLLKGFIDITQKQSALKARISALAKLETYYKTVLDKLDKRILAVEQNRDALIQGIRVVDIPGADLNIIIRSTK